MFMSSYFVRLLPIFHYFSHIFYMFENSYVLLFVVFFCSIFYLWVKNYPLIDVDYIFLHIYFIICI